MGILPCRQTPPPFILGLGSDPATGPGSMLSYKAESDLPSPPPSLSTREREPQVQQIFRDAPVGKVAFLKGRSWQSPQCLADSDLLSCPMLWHQTLNALSVSPWGALWHPAPRACPGSSQTISLTPTSNPTGLLHFFLPVLS